MQFDHTQYSNLFEHSPFRAELYRLECWIITEEEISDDFIPEHIKERKKNLPKKSIQELTEMSIDTYNDLIKKPKENKIEVVKEEVEENKIEEPKEKKVKKPVKELIKEVVEEKKVEEEPKEELIKNNPF